MNPTHEELLADLSADYFIHKLTIGEIVGKYDISRYKIGKYLEEAEELGIVRIEINTPFIHNNQLEASLAKQFTGVHFNVLAENDSQPNRDFSKFVAESLSPRIRQTQIVGLTWGDTIFKVIDALPVASQENLTFLQFIGEYGKFNSLAGSMRMVQKIAAKYSANYLTLSAPTYILNPTTRQLLAQEPTMIPVLKAANKMDLLISGIGTIASLTSVERWNHLATRLFSNQDDKIAGFAFGRPYGTDGKWLIQENDPTFGLSVAEILKSPQRVAIAENKFKVDAVLGALAGHIYTDYFLSEQLAAKVLSRN